MKAVNLIPGEQRAGSEGLAGRSEGAALVVLGLLVGLAVMVFMYGKAHHQISSQAGQVAVIEAQTRAVEARTGKLSAYASFVSMAEQRAQTVAQLVQSRFDWSHALHELGRVLPAEASLSTMNGIVGSTTSSGAGSSAAATAATPTSSTPPGSTPVFTLTGCATSQSEVAQTLQRLRLIDGASEVQLQSSTKSAAGGAGTTSGSCPGGDPSFSAQVTFTALPQGPVAHPFSGAAPASSTTSSNAAKDEPVSSTQSNGAPR